MIGQTKNILDKKMKISTSLDYSFINLFIDHIKIIKLFCDIKISDYSVKLSIPWCIIESNRRLRNDAFSLYLWLELHIIFLC